MQSNIKIKIRQNPQIGQLMNDLNNVYQNLAMCRLTKHKTFTGTGEYILFTALSYVRLESVCKELEVVINRLKFIDWETK